VTIAAAKKPQVRGIQSIEIGYRVLLAVQAGPKEVTLRDIANRADLTASAAHNYLVSLVRTGLVQTDQRGSYRLGPSAVALGLTAMRHVTPFDVVHAEAMRLHDTIGCGIAVLTWSDDGPIIIFKREGVQRGPYVLRNGHVPILTTGGGNVFIAYLAEKLTKPIVQAEMRLKGTPSREYPELRGKIRDSVKASGYSARRLETLPGYGALSAPVWDLNDDVAYALTLTGPAEQLDFESDGSHIPMLLESTRRASMQLGANARHWRTDTAE
jgi:DNA-binding IclR family transcriptional regulator